MTAEGHKVASLHGAKDSTERDAVIDRFREGREKVLITTNVLARGIDVLQVNLVINYDLPMLNERENWQNKNDVRPDIETYIHRIGEDCRTHVWGFDPDVILPSFRPHRTIRTEGNINQFRPQPLDARAHEHAPERDGEAHHQD